ncbi:MAG: RNA polymerase sigma factor [Gammaproteobacteria bacterium]|nr:RNA polymerase sigma factor [Gammaproteobacteria bacterium]
MTDGRKPSGVSGIVSVFWHNEVPLKRFLRRFTSSHHDVDDICQETILRALEAERDREIREPRAFLYGIARNVVRDRLDRESRSIIDFIADFSPDEYLHHEPSVEEQLDSRKRMMLFTEAAATLPGQCQRVFVLKKVYGYSHKEIARELDISISTVEKHVAAGLKRCLEYMQQHAETNTDRASDKGRGSPIAARRKLDR